MFRLRITLYSLLMLTVLLTACGGALPRQIASAPRSPIAQYPVKAFISYRSYMELKVSDVDWSADQAEHLAYDQGGYLAGSQSWYADGRKITTLELEVPTARYSSMRSALLSLGELVSESITSEVADPGYGGYTPYSHITLQLRPGGITLPPVDRGGWSPIHTLQNALSVSAAIFGFVVDILIWVIVVGGPFLLIALGIRWILRRSRRA